MKNVFENIVVKSTDDYEWLVRERLDDLKEESPESFIAEPYIDYQDSIDDDYLDEDMSVEEIKENITFSICENYDMYDASLAVINDLISEINVDLDEDAEIDYDGWSFKDSLITNYIVEDLNIDKLCGQSKLYMNIFPYQGENANTEGSELEIALEALVKRYVYPEGSFYYVLPDNNDELEEIINKNKLLTKLFESQDYEFQDIGDEEKVKNSKFLSSLIQEINNNTLFGSAFLTFLVKSDASEYLDCFRNEDMEIVFKPKEELICGIFNPVNGSGSVLELELEKPFACPTNELFIQIESRDANYGYTVNEVCGLCTSAWTNNFYFIQDEEKLSKKYEAFKLQWMLDHDYTIQDIFKELDEIYEGWINHDGKAPKPSILFDEFESDYGFNEELYPSFEEWLENDYKESN